MNLMCNSGRCCEEKVDASHLCCLFFQVDSLTVESMAKTADMSVTEFADQTSRALTGQTTSQDNFVFQAKPKETKLQVG